MKQGSGFHLDIYATYETLLKVLSLISVQQETYYTYFSSDACIGKDVLELAVQMQNIY